MKSLLDTAAANQNELASTASTGRSNLQSTRELHLSPDVITRILQDIAVIAKLARHADELSGGEVLAVRETAIRPEA
jgi:hypothetical protein